jgi:hypothetical protein
LARIPQQLPHFHQCIRQPGAVADFFFDFQTLLKPCKGFLRPVEVGQCQAELVQAGGFELLVMNGSGFGQRLLAGGQLNL